MESQSSAVAPEQNPPLTAEERAGLMCFWNAAVVAGCLFYFGNGVWTTIAVTALVLFAALINYGRRHLMRMGFAAMTFTIGVAVGVVSASSSWSNMLGSPGL